MRRSRWVIAGTAAVLLAWLGQNRAALWQAAYPHLPRRAQAVPYVLRARLALDAATPVPLPTAHMFVEAAVEDGGASPARGAPTDSPGALRAFSPPAGRAPTSWSPSTPGSGSRDASAVQGEASTGPTPRPVEALPPLAPAVHLGPGPYEAQTWNNCGPATISMVLGRLGTASGQAAAARVLKPDPDDKNVGPHELAAYARSHGYGAIVRVNGDLERLRRLLAIGLPVIVETWFVPSPGDEMGHYRVLVGYDDSSAHFIADDSYNGPGVALPYQTLDDLWRVFNRTYVVVYPLERETQVALVLGDHVDERLMYLSAVARALDENAERGDAFSFFNLGSALLGLGDADGAAGAYDRARALGLPWRMLWYQFGPFEAYAAVGRWHDVTALAAANLRNAGNLEESHYWLGRAHQAEGDAEAAADAWRTALRYNPTFAPAAEALAAAEGA